MEKYLTVGLIQHIIGFQLVILLILISNIWLTHRARRHVLPPSFPLISILVPARNEENKIKNCVLSLLAQDYPFFEVLVLDDQSTDKTRTILQEIAKLHSNLRIIEGKPAPLNQCGKNWACAQLADQANGDYFLFTDADTVHKPNSLESIVTSLFGEKADLLTGFPNQQTNSWGERLLVPFFSWAMICFIPLGIAYRLRRPALTSAVGQMMFFRREAYEQIGGHAGINNAIVDDLSLARLIKSHGLRWRVAYIADLISCRMYNSSREAYQGFVKNLFAAFDYRLLPFSFVFGWLFIMFWTPILVLILLSSGAAPSAKVLELSSSIILSLLLWILPYRELKLPLPLAFLYPATVLANIMVAFQSCRQTISGNLYWKDRPLAKQKWRWI